ncbi:hypothetical protein ACU5AX_05020 [Sphingomonas sp. XXL09]
MFSLIALFFEYRRLATQTPAITAPRPVTANDRAATPVRLAA